MMPAGPHMLTFMLLQVVGRQEVLQQPEKGAFSGPLGPRLGQSWSGGQHTLVALTEGEVNEGIKKL
jgi:hypothetical protein